MKDSRAPEPDPKEEFVQQDDAVIGRALRISAGILIVILAVVGVIVLVLNREPVKGPEIKTQIAAPVAPAPRSTEAPQIEFTDITAAAGIDFIHNNGAAGDKLLPESLGGGVAFFDADGDGDQDLLFVNSIAWPWDRDEKPEAALTTSKLYRNDTPVGGPVKFTDVTVGSGLDVPLYGMGVAAGDFDNDGLTDIYLTCVGENRLFKNLGDGRFRDVTETAGVAGAADDWSTAATFFDYDNDGHPDLFVANYVQWSREIDFQVNFTIDGTHRAYGPPTDFEGAFPRLYRNRGDGTFEEVSETAGVMMRNPSTGVAMAKSLGVAPVDVNEDGWIDLIVANDTVRNFLFLNRGDGTFEERGAVSGVAYDSNGTARGAMGIDTAQHRNDGALGVAIGNFANEMTALFVSQNTRDQFVDEAIAEGIGPASRLPLKFGIFFFDADLDGWPELLSVNGHLDEDITKLQASQQYAQPAQLFWNNRGDGFVVIDGERSASDLFQPIVGRGSAYADIDGDGDLDVVFTQLHGPPLLLRNDLVAGNNWLRVKLDGGDRNADAIGATVILRAGETTLTRQVMPTKSYLSQSELPVTFGLGDDIGIDELEVRWEDGSLQRVSTDDLDLNQTLTIRRD